MGDASLALARRDHDALENHRRIFSLMAEVAEVELPAIPPVATR
jgi:hypothetical protein